MAHKKAAASAHKSGRKPRKRGNTPKKHALTPAMEARKWKPGQSGNPSGRPKRDFSAELSRAVIEENADLIYAAMVKALRRGSTGTFLGLAERGYGKAPQHVEVSGPDGGSLKVEFVNVATLQES